MDELTQLKRLFNVKNKRYKQWLNAKPGVQADAALDHYRKCKRLYQESCIHYVEMKMEVGNV